ncbi:hypothetical protein Tco_0053764 [Tanacetum coccineum]
MKPEVIKSFLKLMNDLQVLKGIQQEKEKPTAQNFTPYGNFSMIEDVEVLMKDIYTFLRKFSRISLGVTLKVILIAWERFGEIKHALTGKQYRQEDIQELMSKLLEDVRNISEKLSEYINCPSWNHPIFYDNDDDEYTIIYSKPTAITLDLPIEEPDNSLIIGDEHLDTSPSVENLVPIPSKFEGISDDACDVPFCENPFTFYALNDHSEILSDSNDDDTSSDDNDFEDIEYVSLEEVNKIQEEKEFRLEDILSNQDGGLTSVVMDEISDNSANDPLLELPEFESFHFDPSFPRPPPEPPDVEICLNFEPDTAMINNFDELNKDEYFDPEGGEIDVFQNIEDDDSFTFVIQTFLPFLTYPVDSPLLLSIRSEDTIFDPGIST